MNLPSQQIFTAQLDAILRRGRLGIVATALTNNAAAMEFWKGYTKAAHDLMNGVGALAAAKDELTSSDAQTGLQAAGASLPVSTKGLTLSDVKQIVAAHGIEVATNTVPHADLCAGEVLEHNVVPRVDGDDEHTVARVDVCDCSDGHGLSSTNQSEASLDQGKPGQPVDQKRGAA